MVKTERESVFMPRRAFSRFSSRRRLFSSLGIAVAPIANLVAGVRRLGQPAAGPRRAPGSIECYDVERSQTLICARQSIIALICELSRLQSEQFCYVTTTGRKSGLPRTIEIWFGVANDRIYLLAQFGDRSHWVRNILADPRVTVRIGVVEWPGSAAIATGNEDRLARELVAAKYEEWRIGEAFDDWVVGALPIVIRLDGSAA